MPSKNEFDEILKDKFEGFEAPLPKGGWDNVRSQIPERRRRFAWMPFMMAASVLMTLVSGYLFLKKSAVPTEELQSIEVEETSTPVIAMESNTSTPAMEAQSIITNSDAQLAEENMTEDESSIPESNDIISNDEEQLIAVAPTNVGNTTTAVNESPVRNNPINVEVVAVLPTTNGNNLIPTKEGEQGVSSSDAEENASTTESTSSVENINAMPTMAIALNASAAKDKVLALATPVDEQMAYYDAKDLEEKNDWTKKFHVGVELAPIYTSQRIEANREDDVTVAQFKGLNKFDKNRAGYSVALNGSYDLTPKLAVISRLSCTSISDQNTYTVTEEVGRHSIRESNGGYTFSTVQEVEKTTEASFHYAGIQAGLQYFINKDKGIYIKGKGGFSRLVSSKGHEDVVYNKNNFNVAAAVGRTFDMGGLFKLSVEPEVTYYLNSYQQDGDFYTKPTTFGINFIATR